MAEKLKYKRIPQLKKLLWKEFSIFIRRRDKGRCFTCGIVKPWKEQDAGHYIPKSVGGSNLYFNERNVHAQCTACNRFRHGNLHQYALRLQEKYGPAILQWLEAYRKKSVPYNAAELTLLIAYYKKQNSEEKTGNELPPSPKHRATANTSASWTVTYDPKSGVNIPSSLHFLDN